MKGFTLLPFFRGARRFIACVHRYDTVHVWVFLGLVYHNNTLTCQQTNTTSSKQSGGGIPLLKDPRGLAVLGSQNHQRQ